MNIESDNSPLQVHSKKHGTLIRRGKYAAGSRRHNSKTKGISVGAREAVMMIATPAGNSKILNELTILHYDVPINILLRMVLYRWGHWCPNTLPWKHVPMWRVLAPILNASFPQIIAGERITIIRWIRSVVLCAAILTGSQWCLAADSDLDRATALMRAGKAGEAYSLLAPLEFEQAGDERYDYLLGIAALDSEHPEKATIAFERVLAVNPSFAGARLDMARAFFALGDYQRARQEFKTVLALDPPPEAKATVKQYLTAIEQREVAKRSSLTGYMESGLGYDSNITAVTNDFTAGVLAAYNIANIQATGNSVLRKSSFLFAGAGLEYTYALDEQLAVFAGLDGRQRDYQQASPFNTQTIDGHVGLTSVDGPNLLRGSLQLQSYRQDGEIPATPPASAPHMDQHSLGLNGEWRHMLDAANQVGLFGQYNRQRFPDLPVFDLDQTIAGASWLHNFSGSGKPLLYSGLLIGRDHAFNPQANGSNMGRSYQGLILFGQYTLLTTVDLYSNLDYQWRNDSSPYARSSLVAYGKDQLSDVAVGANWHFLSNWSARGQLLYTHNNSNIALYTFDRTETSVVVRRDF